MQRIVDNDVLHIELIFFCDGFELLSVKLQDDTKSDARFVYSFEVLKPGIDRDGKVYATLPYYFYEVEYDKKDMDKYFDMGKNFP